MPHSRHGPAIIACTITCRDELPALIQTQFSVGDRCAISGHSMGGHGALIMALKNPGQNTPASAFAPYRQQYARAVGESKRLPLISAKMNQHGLSGIAAELMLASRPRDAIPGKPSSGRQRSIPRRSLQPTVLAEAAAGKPHGR